MSAPPDPLLATLLTVFPDGVLVCNGDGLIRHHNARAAELLALTVAEGDRPAARALSSFVGHPITHYFDGHLIGHARAELHTRLADGTAQPRAYFAATLGMHQILRV